MSLAEFLREIAEAAQYAVPCDSGRCVVALLIAPDGSVDIEDGTVAALELTERRRGWA